MSDKAAETPAPKSEPLRPPSPLTRPTDAAPRPGFRAPPNKGSKAQKGPKKKR